MNTQPRFLGPQEPIVAVEDTVEEKQEIIENERNIPVH